MRKPPKAPEFVKGDTIIYSPHTGCDKSDKETRVVSSEPFLHASERYYVVFLEGKSGYVSAKNCKKVSK